MILELTCNYKCKNATIIEWKIYTSGEKLLRHNLGLICYHFVCLENITTYSAIIQKSHLEITLVSDHTSNDDMHRHKRYQCIVCLYFF